MNAIWKGIATLAAAVMIGAPSMARAADEEGQSKYANRLVESKETFQDLMTSNDRSVPEPLLRKAKCVVVIPGMVKGALGFGARWGNGVMSCRGANGWSAPVFVDIKGGSWGLQIGAQKTDLVLFFMTEKGARSLVNRSKFTLGGSASVAAGPLGRSGEADTDLHLNAEIYSYAKSKGLFAGISLEGASLKVSTKANEAYYGPKVSPRGILFASHEPEMKPEARDFIAVLPRY
ncbi:MAG TPA: lipid-binding SYLF domain-containing protein [Candidatus Angelobacter sp.]|nr:lipid-binding SYLF domain-containing protein [Candidatus Angelobacter sp.]